MPKTPNAEPPKNNPVVGTTHDNTPAKGEFFLSREGGYLGARLADVGAGVGVVKIQPKANRGDKGFSKDGPPGDGTV